jgi:hypothetical protein
MESERDGANLKSGGSLNEGCGKQNAYWLLNPNAIRIAFKGFMFVAIWV